MRHPVQPRIHKYTELIAAMREQIEQGMATAEEKEWLRAVIEAREQNDEWGLLPESPIRAPEPAQRRGRDAFLHHLTTNPLERVFLHFRNMKKLWDSIPDPIKNRIEGGAGEAALAEQRAADDYFDAHENWTRLDPDTTRIPGIETTDRETIRAFKAEQQQRLDAAQKAKAAAEQAAAQTAAIVAHTEAINRLPVQNAQTNDAASPKPGDVRYPLVIGDRLQVANEGWTAYHVKVDAKWRTFTITRPLSVRIIRAMYDLGALSAATAKTEKAIMRKAGRPKSKIRGAFSGKGEGSSEAGHYADFSRIVIQSDRQHAGRYFLAGT